MPITVKHVDFIGVPTQDVERSRSFYVDVVGLPLERTTPTGFEVSAGQVTLGVWAPEQMGLPFTASPNAFALHVDDVAEARRTLEPTGWRSRATPSTPASVTWRSSAIPMATR